MNGDIPITNGDTPLDVAPVGEEILWARQDATKVLYEDIREYVMRQYWMQLTDYPFYGDIEMLEERLRDMTNPQEFEELEFSAYELYISALPTLGERSQKPGDIHEGKMPYREMEPYLGAIGGAQYADVLREM